MIRKKKKEVKLSYEDEYKLLSEDVLSIHELQDDYKQFIKERESILPISESERDIVEKKIKLALLKMFKKAKELANGKDEDKGFFRYEDVFAIPEIKDYFPIVMANGDRNIGKSYSSKRIARNTVASGKRFMWWRNIDDEVKAQIKSDLYGGGWIAKNGWMMAGSKKMPDIIDLNKNIVGFYRALNTSAKFKSTDFPNVDLIIYEEFNEVGITNKYLKMVKMISTIQRFNPSLKVILQANYVDQQDEILQKLGLGSKKLTKDDFVIFNWYVGSIIINIPKNIYRKPKDKQADLGYRASLADQSVWKSQYGGGFANEEPINIVSDNDLLGETIVPIFNIYVENIESLTSTGRKYGAFKLTLYHVYDKEGNKLNVLREMVGSNDKQVFVLDHLMHIKYPSAELVQLETLDDLIWEWQRGNLKTVDMKTHTTITAILARAKKTLENNKVDIEDVENMVE